MRWEGLITPANPNPNPNPNPNWRWEGLITPDTTVKDALFQIKTAGNGRARFTLEGHVIIDAWDSQKELVSRPVNLEKGRHASTSDSLTLTWTSDPRPTYRPLSFRMDYFQSNSTGNPNIALQWSRLSSSMNSEENIQAATSLIQPGTG